MFLGNGILSSTYQLSQLFLKSSKNAVLISTKHQQQVCHFVLKVGIM